MAALRVRVLSTQTRHIAPKCSLPAMSILRRLTAGLPI
jgi:hypothetical protein